MRKQIFTFKVILLISFCLVLLFSIANSASHLIGQTQLAGEAKFPKHDHDEWKFDQYNPDLEASIKITSTINTYFRILYKSLINGTLYDYGFLFDQTSPKAMEDYTYERGLVWVWLARWKDYGIQLDHFDYRPEFRELNTSQGAPYKVRVDPDAFLYFKDDLNKAEGSPLSDYKFVLTLKDEHWLIQSVKGYSPDHNIYPRGSDFNEIASAIPDSIEISTTESDEMAKLKRRNVPPRMVEIRKKIEELHKGEKKLSTSDIKKNYKLWQIERIIRFDDIFALVEYSMPTVSNRYDFYNMLTGERQHLPTSIYYVTLYKIKHWNRSLFSADGTNGINGDRAFPFIIECQRHEDGVEFKMDKMTRYYGLSKSVEFGRKVKATLIDLRISITGIECGFGPMKGYEGNFYAAYTDIPSTKTAYNEEKHQFIITFENTKIHENVMSYDQELKRGNPFLNKVELIQDNEHCKVVVSLKETAKYYTGKKNWIEQSPYPSCVKFSFISQSDYNDYVMMEL